MKVFHTENSTYEFTETHYRRSSRPGKDQPIGSHRLVYGAWLPLRSFDVVELANGARVLHIMAEDSVVGIFTSQIVEEGA